MARTVLFLCTGNYYRSRFAELLFNARATATGLSWRAFSRGLALEKGVNNVGPISLEAVVALKRLGILIPDGQRYPRQAEEHDFHTADLIIALKQAEHQPYICDRYPAWAERVHYWHVHDRIPSLEYDPLKEIEHEIHHLLLTLRQLSV